MGNRRLCRHPPNQTDRRKNAPGDPELLVRELGVIDDDAVEKTVELLGIEPVGTLHGREAFFASSRAPRGVIWVGRRMWKQCPSGLDSSRPRVPGSAVDIVFKLAKEDPPAWRPMAAGLTVAVR